MIACKSELGAGIVPGRNEIVQQGTKELERFAFYAMISGYFDLVGIHLKLMPGPWAFGSKQM